MTMDLLARNLTPRVDRPVVDMTGLEGVYEIDVRWEPTEGSGRTMYDPAIIPAVQQQLGLKLEGRKAQCLSVRLLKRPMVRTV